MSLPTEVRQILKDETSSFKNYTTQYILENYELGPSDMILRFFGGEVQVLKKTESDRRLLEVRSQLLALMLKGYDEKHPGKLKDLDVVIPVCLSDTSDRPLQEIPCLVFSKTSFSNNILIPSVNNLAYDIEIQTVNGLDSPTHKKEKSLCFVGSLTGNTSDDIENNVRVQLLEKLIEWEDDHRFMKLIRPPKMENGQERFEQTILDISKRLPNQGIDNIKKYVVNSEERVGIADQLKHRYQLCVDGHTCAWARLPWQMQSNCVPIKIRNKRHDWKEWFYYLLNPCKHFLEVDIEDLSIAYEYLKNNPQAENDIVQAGKDFVSKYYSLDFAQEVLIETLILLNNKQNNDFFQGER